MEEEGPDPYASSSSGARRGGVNPIRNGGVGADYINLNKRSSVNRPGWMGLLTGTSSSSAIGDPNRGGGGVVGRRGFSRESNRRYHPVNLM